MTSAEDTAGKVVIAKRRMTLRELTIADSKTSEDGVSR
jgi:hypothetical protein